MQSSKTPCRTLLYMLDLRLVTSTAEELGIGVMQQQEMHLVDAGMTSEGGSSRIAISRQYVDDPSGDARLFKKRRHPQGAQRCLLRYLPLTQQAGFTLHQLPRPRHKKKINN